MNFLEYDSHSIHEIGGEVFIDGRKSSRFTTANDAFVFLRNSRESKYKAMQESLTKLTSKIISEDVNNIQMSNGDLQIALDEAINEDLSLNRLTIELRKSVNDNPFRKYQFVLESGEKVSISDQTLNRIVESKKIPKNLLQLIQYV